MTHRGSPRHPVAAACLLALATISVGGALTMGASPTGSAAPAASPAASPGPSFSAVEPWSYRTELIVWDPATGDWSITYTGGTRVDGLDAILNGNGAAGWELVAIYPEVSVHAAVDGLAGEDVRRVRAVYKQPVR